MSQAGTKLPLGGGSLTELERNKSLLRQARGTSTALLSLTYLGEVGVVLLLTYLATLGDAARRTEFLPWLTCSLLVIVLGAQLAREMQTNKRIDGLLTILTRKRLFDDEVADTTLMLEASGSATRRSQS